MSQSEEDLEQEKREWCELHRGVDEFEGGEEDNVAAGADGKVTEVIDCDADQEGGKQRKDIAARSPMWEHFTKVKENGVVIKGNCKYCKHDIMAHPVFNGTSALKRHFNSCKSNPNRIIKDGKQGILQIKEGNNISTWKFDPEALRVAFCEMVIEDEEPFARQNQRWY